MNSQPKNVLIPLLEKYTSVYKINKFPVGSEKSWNQLDWFPWFLHISKYLTSTLQCCRVI